jgi:hypothetical protein
MTGVVATVVGSLGIAAVSTLGDFIWAAGHLRHRTEYGLTHGTLLFLAIGLFLGVLAHRPALGAIWGAVLGFLAAGSFYVLAPFVGYSAMFVVWIAIWLALAVLYTRLAGLAVLNVRQVGLWAVLGRGAAAAVTSGIAFYAISGIWRPFNPEGWDYAVHFGAWTLAYLPGFAALLISRAPR